MINGATFYFLDGGDKGFPRVIFNLEANKPRLASLFAEYTKAGINWIRVINVCQHFGKLYSADDVYDKPGVYIQKVNEFLRFARSCGQFTFEVMLDPRRTWPTDNFLDYPEYELDKAWMRKWIEGLDYSSLGLIMLPGDIYPVMDGRGYGDSLEAVYPRAYNNGHWVTEVLNYLHYKYPNLHINFEMGLWGTTPENIQKAVHWHNKYFPWTWWIAFPLYYSLPPGATWEQYRDGMVTIFNAYKECTGKPMWIDEYGAPVTIQAGGYTEEDQEAYYHGMLEAMKLTSCEKARFAWVAGMDHPYDGKTTYGIVKGFNGSVPQWRPAWDTVRTYYKP